MAALVAASALGERGRRVRLLLPERGIGGGFATLRHAGRALELGVRLLELRYEDEPERPPPLRDYEPGIGGHRPYVGLIRAWAEGLVGGGLVEAGRPQMVVDGRWVEDPLFTVDLAGLASGLPGPARERIAEEAGAARAAEGDAGVLDPARAAELEGLSFEAASLRNHGPALHGLLAPLAGKFWRGGAAELAAPLRRKAWMALFWPRTVEEAMRGAEPAFRPHRPFHTVAPEGPGALVSALLARLEGQPEVTIERPGALSALEAGAPGVRLGFAGGARAEAASAIVGSSPGEVFAAAGIDYAPERVRTVIAWVECAEEDILALAPLVHLADEALPAARVSTGGGGAPEGRRLLTVELRHDLAEEAIEEATRRSLEGAGILLKGAPLMPIRHVSVPSFAAPTRENAAAFAAARARLLERELPVSLIGGAADFAADALNEQVVAGLRAAEEAA